MESPANFIDIIDKHSFNRGNKVAIYCGAEKITYKTLNENINRFGNIFRNVGVKPDRQVILAFPDCPASCYAFFGALKCGAKPALLSPDLSRSDYDYILSDCEAAALVTVKTSEAAMAGTQFPVTKLFIDDPDFSCSLAKADDQLESHCRPPEEISFIQYTSGSTGNPKGVPHSQRDMIFSARQYAGHILNMTDRDVVFSASKLFFGYGFGNSVTFPLYYGASTVLYPGRPTPDNVFQIIQQYGITLFFSVPTFYHMLIKTMEGPAFLPSLRLCVSAGEALPADTYGIWKKLTKLEIIDGIGSTEALHIFISNRPGDVRPGSSGFPVPGYETKIVDESGMTVRDGGQGILQVRGQSTAPFYWNKPSESAQNMLPDGWLNTGDYYIAEKGCYTYQGRRDDLFKVGGAWVSPVRVEEAMRSHPAVFECAVTSRKMEGLLQPMAYVVLAPDYQEDPALTRQIRGHVLNQLPGYMCPVQINYVAQIPKTRTGKVQRFRLRE
jgi:benzoate-CoA ligase family protein